MWLRILGHFPQHGGNTVLAFKQRKEREMKPCALTLAISLTLGGNSLAQDVGAGASNQSATSISASRNSASAQQANNASAAAASKHAAANAAEASEMNATLTKPVDARRAKPGDEVTATLAHDATADGGTRMPRGTRLIGHVTEAQPHERRSGSSSADAGSRLGIVFDKAVLSDGREVPVAATIQAVGQATASSSARDYDASGSAFGAGNAATSGAAAGGAGLVGRVAGTGSAALGGAAGAGAGLGRGLASSASSTAQASASRAAVGGIGATGELVGGSRGVFGMHGVDIAHGAAGSANGSVLTSDTGNVQLSRGTQMLLVSQATGSASATGFSGAAAQ